MVAGSVADAGLVSFQILIASRIFLGIAEGPAYPVAMHAVYKWFPDSLRAMPTALIAQGSTAGVILAVPALNWIIVHYSWHWAFAALGLAGLLWAVLWASFGREGTLVDPPIAEDLGSGPVPYRYLLTCPSIVAACCAGFAAYWGLALGLTWFTSYLVDGLGFSQSAGGNLSVLPWAIGALVVLVGGWISQRLKTAGSSSRLSRGVFPSLTLMLGGCLLPVVGLLPSPGLKVALVTVGGAIGATIYVVIPMIVSELTPQTQRAAMLAIVNSAIGCRRYRSAGHGRGRAESRVARRLRERLPRARAAAAGGRAVGLLFIRPELDRMELARHALSAASVHPARG